MSHSAPSTAVPALRRIQVATFTSAPWLGHAATHVHVWGYLPVLVAAGVWVHVCRRSAYRTLRTALVVFGVLGLIVAAVVVWSATRSRLVRVPCVVSQAARHPDRVAAPG